MASKRAFLVIGSESSGTKVLTKAFLRAGCAGDGWHKQRFDNEDPSEDAIVYRRSFPHGDEWPDLMQIMHRFEALGYEVMAVVIVRSMQFTIASRKNSGVGKPLFRVRRAFSEIGTQLAETGLPFVWVTYEELVQRPKETFSWLLVNWAGLSMPKIKIKDSNQKYVG